MKNSILLLAMLAAAALSRSIIPAIPDSVTDSSLIAGNSRFAVELFSEISQGSEGGNIFFSPFSISMALGMTWNGATGETARDMAEVLNFDMPVYFVNRSFERITEKISSGTVDEMGGDPLTMTVSNGIWVQDGFQLLNSFTEAVTGFYGASAENLDFTSDPEGSREEINEWVAESTMQKIIDLLAPGTITPDTRLVLTNAVYFKAGWLYPFEELATAEGGFTRGDGEKVTVPMMNQTEFFDYASSDEWQAVRMRYAGGSSSMLIILPRNMESYLEGFGEETVADVERRLSRVNVALSMPRFEYSQSISMGDILVSMGMELPFSGEADFSAITGSPDLFISQVLHKAYVKVDEAGTEAAAATAVVMNITSAPSSVEQMIVDRPFIFLIKNDETGSILFMGLVNDPSVS